ncbi:SGNH/GDSL hydrolase family protein [Mucilaginibacter sp. UR6-11]|uniref:SGNH/GDSL hydrolase family protein n=1 Tax=Mucilaginibacter sp. UR6-11 TaxID=1435644 RepID=UPI001E29DAA4|nr:SGNH/GDSL hydrolase family protein [Mucilaginibacter sp. UR6-11]MCC8426851.1 SGNH/GDSL hydrolase family protein [Mucilaginibacter sp. UR6-11]
MKNRSSKLVVFVAILLTILQANLALAQSKLVKNLAAGKPQTLVAYGTSLTAAAGGHAWVDSVNRALNKKYSGLLKTVNAAKSGMWSTWGVQNLEDSVIRKNPDAVLIEFSMNDAFLSYKTSVELARLNLNYMIDRLKLYNPDCEVILQTMNIALNVHATARPDLLKYYQMYRDVAKARGLLLIDHYPHWQELLAKGKDAYLSEVPDGIHPGIEASKNIIAPYVIKLLEGRK